MDNFHLYVIAAVIAFGLSSRDVSNQSMTLSGGLATTFVRLSIIACSIKFGFILILLYYTSSEFMKLKQEYKASIEEDYAVGGQRNRMQVLAISALASVAAWLAYFLCGEDRHVSFGAPQAGEELVNLASITLPKSTLATYLWVLYIAHYCTANADTWASELGVLSTHEPRLVTSLFLRAVPRGTNGGMSLFGTAASAVGGLFVGLVFWAFTLIMPNTRSARGIPPCEPYPVLLFSLLCGLLGSLVDSVLGATVQATYYSKERKCIVKQLAQKGTEAAQDASIVRICGLDILSNEAVNLLSIFITMVLSLWLAPNVFCWQDATQCYEADRMNSAVYGILGGLR